MKSRLSRCQCGLSWLHLGYCLHAARSTHSTLEYFRAPNTKNLVPSVFCLHEGKSVGRSTATIVGWIRLKQPSYVGVGLGAIAALTVMSPYNTCYSERNINQNILSTQPQCKRKTRVKEKQAYREVKGLSEGHGKSVAEPKIYYSYSRLYTYT